MSREKRFHRSERALIAAGIIVPTLALIALATEHRYNAVPDFVPPASKLPVPNALDTLRSAYKKRVANLGERGKPDFVVIDSEANSKEERELSQPLEKRRRLLAANKEAIEGVRAALGQGYASPIDWERSYMTLFPHYAEHRAQARLLLFASRVHADEGNLAEATRCALDAIELGVLIESDGPLIGLLVGMACEAIGRKGLWELADKLDAKTIQAALERLERIEKRRPPLTDALKIERAFSQCLIRDLARGKVSASTLLALTEGVPGGGPPWLLHWKIAWTDKRAAWRASGAYFDALAERWERPYSRAPLPPFPNDPINRLLLPILDRCDFNHALGRTDGALLRGYLMARLARQASGSFPEMLVGAPADPFGQEKPLRYKKSGESFLLWSVGPDEKDDSGAPIQHGKTPRNYQPGDAGDVLARVNTY